MLIQVIGSLLTGYQAADTIASVIVALMILPEWWRSMPDGTIRDTPAPSPAK